MSEEIKFWALLVLYTILSPCWFVCAYFRRNDAVEMVAMILLGLICGLKAVFRWSEI